VPSIYKTRHFARWQRKSSLPDADLAKAVSEMERGLVDADLGGGVLKKRIALPGRGKSGGARTLVATNRAGRWFFIFGFEKNERSSVSAKELEGLQAIAADLLKLSAAEVEILVRNASLSEVKDE
jgi:hypothetical protein